MPAGAQVVHLDLKSSNVLLDSTDARLAKVADLGVSKFLAEGSRLELSQLPGAAPAACAAPVSSPVCAREGPC